MFISFFAGIQMSAAKIMQVMTGMVCQKGRAEFVSEIGCGPKKLLGARTRRWRRKESNPPFDAAWIYMGAQRRGNIEQGIPPRPHAPPEAIFHVDFPYFRRVNYCSQKRELL
jgi:hypothetical protein